MLNGNLPYLKEADHVIELLRLKKFSSRIRVLLLSANSCFEAGRECYSCEPFQFGEIKFQQNEIEDEAINLMARGHTYYSTALTIIHYEQGPPFSS